MTAKRWVRATCACGFCGELPTLASCPACGASHDRRVNQARAGALARIAEAGPAVPVHVEPMTRIWLVSNGLVRETGRLSRVRLLGRGRLTVVGRMFELTQRGVEVERLARSRPIASSSLSAGSPAGSPAASADPEGAT